MSIDLDRHLECVDFQLIEKQEDEDFKSLSRREKEVLSCFNRGYNTQAVSDILFVSTSTIKTHLHNIYAKLNPTQNSNLYDSRLRSLVIFRRNTKGNN